MEVISHLQGVSAGLHCGEDHHLTKFIQSAYLSKPGKSNQRMYQNEEGAVNVMPNFRPELSNVLRSVLSIST